jgi:26S proteasome regulatory subunit N10
MDNSDWTRNGDYDPNRWESEVGAANLIAETKCERNPENGIGVISMAGKRVEVHVTLTNDVSRLLNSIKAVHLSGESDFITALNIATLTLKHRQNKNQKQRIILFVGSPVKHSIDEMIQTAKKLKKYNIAVDVISLGNVDENREALTQFLNHVNNANNSSLQEVPVGFNVMDVLFSSPLFNEAYDMQDSGIPMTGANNNVAGTTGTQNVPSSGTGNLGGQGGMSQFERDMHLAIQQSLEEEKKLKEGSTKPTTTGTTTAKPNTSDQNVEMTGVNEENEEDALEAAKRMSMEEHMKVLKKEKDAEGIP